MRFSAVEALALLLICQALLGAGCESEWSVPVRGIHAPCAAQATSQAAGKSNRNTVKKRVSEISHTPETALRVDEVGPPYRGLPEPHQVYVGSHVFLLVSNNKNKEKYWFDDSGLFLGHIYPAGRGKIWISERLDTDGCPVSRVTYRIRNGRSSTIYVDSGGCGAGELCDIERTLYRWRFYRIRGNTLIRTTPIKLSFGDLDTESRHPGSFFAVEELRLARHGTREQVVEELGEYIRISNHRGQDGLFDTVRTNVILRRRDHRVLQWTERGSQPDEDKAYRQFVPKRLWHWG